MASQLSRAHAMLSALFPSAGAVCNAHDDHPAISRFRLRCASEQARHRLTHRNHNSILPFVLDSSIANLPIPIVSLTTDFGLDDWYVAAMKAVLLSHSPAARLVDITHTIPPGDIIKGSITLERALASFPPSTIHLAVIDPTVGSDRRALVVRIHQQLVVCPDNGLITWPIRRLGPFEAFQITWKPLATSPTFHGRDLFAPIAGRLASFRA